MDEENSTIVAYEFIKKGIVNGEYEPGYQLLTAPLAEKIGVSPTPIRDALRMLEVDGLVSIGVRAGASVKKIEPREFKDLCELRVALECHAAGLAAQNWDELSLAGIQGAFERMREITDQLVASDTEDKDLAAQVLKEDTLFHLAILEASGNVLIKKEILRLNVIKKALCVSQSLVRRQDRDNYWNKPRWTAVCKSHQTIFDAIVARDVAGARSAMEDHLQAIIRSTIKDMIARSKETKQRVLTPEELAYSS